MHFQDDGVGVRLIAHRDLIIIRNCEIAKSDVSAEGHEVINGSYAQSD
jgi:hypothetical protein